MNKEKLESLKFFLETKIKSEGVKDSPRDTIISFIESLESIDKKEIPALNYYLLENTVIDSLFVSKILDLPNSFDYNSLLISLVIDSLDTFSQIYLKSSEDLKKDIFKLVSAINNKKAFDFILEHDPELNDVLIFNKFYDLDKTPFLDNLKYDKQTILDTTNFFINTHYNFVETKNVNESIKLVYPKSGKKLFKILAQKMFQGKYINWEYMHFAHYCSVYFEDYNDFQDIVESVPSVSFYKKLIPLHFILEKFPRKTLKSIIISSGQDINHDLEILVKDFKTQYEQLLKICENEYIIDHKKVNSIKDLHDIATRDLSLATRHGANFYLGLEFKYPFLRSLKLKKFEEYNIVVPKDNYTLVEWGQKMNNCIGSYSNSAKEGRSIVFGLYQDNEIKYNVEIGVDDKKIIQFVSHGNHRVSEDLGKKLSQMITDTLTESLNQEIEVDEEAKSYRKLFELNNTPIDIKQNELNKIFLINQRIETKQAGIELTDDFYLIKGGLATLLEDKLTKNKLLKLIIQKEKVSFIGLKKTANELNQKSHKKINIEKFDESIVDVLKSGVKFIAFDVQGFYKKKDNEDFPQKITADDLETVYKKMKEFKDITFIHFQQEIKKSKEISYFGKSVSESYADQIIFTSQSRVIDNEMKVNILKNTIGKENYFIKMKN